MGALSEHGYMLPEVEHPQVRSSSSVLVLDEVEYSFEFPEVIKSTSPEPVLDEVEYSSEFLEVKSTSSEPILDEVEYSSEFPEVKSISSEPVLDEVECSSDLDSQLPKKLQYDLFTSNAFSYHFQVKSDIFSLLFVPLPCYSMLILQPRAGIRFSAAEVVDYAMNDGPRESLTDLSGSKLVPAVNRDDMDVSNVKNAVRVV